jgi:hypothetical protein
MVAQRRVVGIGEWDVFKDLAGEGGVEAVLRQLACVGTVRVGVPFG